MFKKIFVILLIIAIALAQGGMVRKQLTQVGGFQEVPLTLLGELRQTAMFTQAEQKARQSYRTTNGQELGQLISVQQQIVAGVNYRMTFASPTGQVAITVFVQPWTNTVELLETQNVSK